MYKRARTDSEGGNSGQHYAYQQQQQQQQQPQPQQPQQPQWHVELSSKQRRLYFFQPGTNVSTFDLPAEVAANVGNDSAAATAATEPLTTVLVGHGSSSGDTVATSGAVFDVTEHLMRLKTTQPHPHPEHELQRAFAVERLREHYNQLCKDKLSLLQAPKESFNHWLYQMFTVPSSERIEPMVPSSSSILAPSTASARGVSPIERQLHDVIPMHVKAERYIESAQQAKQQVDQFIRSCLRLCKKVASGSKTSAVSAVEVVASGTLTWLDESNSSTTKEAFLNKLTEVREQVRLPMQEIANPVVMEIMDGLNAAADKESHVLGELSAKMTPATGVPFAFDPPLGRDALKAVLDDRFVQVSYKNELRLALQLRHWNKLRQLYQRQNTHEDLFLPRLWCMLRRYQTLSGVKTHEGSGFQAALPESVFKHLQTNLGVDFECFASPLNCYFPNFASAFADTDRFFGSMGSFFDLDLVEGSAEANPPFNEEAMTAMVDRIEYLLGKSASPLSFTVFVPEWISPPTPAIPKMLNSKFLRADRIIPKLKHTFKNGSQHLVDDQEMYFEAIHDSHVFVLQNDAGNAKWQPTPEVMEGIETSWAQPLDKVTRRFSAQS